MKKISQSKLFGKNNKYNPKRKRMRLKKFTERELLKKLVTTKHDRKEKRIRKLKLRNKFLKNLNENIVEAKKPKPKAAPWITEETMSKSGSLKLHHEILDFFNFIIPKEEENNLRQQTIKNLKDLIVKRWPMWKVKVFGSFPNGLHLSDSDIDLVVFKNKGLDFSTENFTKYDPLMTDNQQLIELYKHIMLSGFAQKADYVDARVPIVRVTAKNGINFDIS
jgi:DNA polymerase sigma